jgi:hypothetical protein
MHALARSEFRLGGGGNSVTYFFFELQLEGYVSDIISRVASEKNIMMPDLRVEASLLHDLAFTYILQLNPPHVECQPAFQE